MGPQTVLHGLSGGIDSTSVLWQLWKAGIPVLLHHLQFRGATRCSAEAEAVARILTWFEDRGQTFELVEHECRLPHGLSDIEVTGLVVGGILRENPKIRTTTVSTSATDQKQATWAERHSRRVQITEIIAGRPIEWLRPNWDKLRRDVIKEMPADLLSLCSFCRRPRAGQPCGSCKTCRGTLKHINDRMKFR